MAGKTRKNEKRRQKYLGFLSHNILGHSQGVAVNLIIQLYARHTKYEGVYSFRLFPFI